MPKITKPVLVAVAVALTLGICKNQLHYNKQSKGFGDGLIDALDRLNALIEVDVWWKF